jgi:catalase
VADGFGLDAIPEVSLPINHHVPADERPEGFEPRRGSRSLERSRALSMTDTVKDTIRSRRIAILVADGVDAESLRIMRAVLLAERALPVLVAPRLGPVRDANGREHWVEQSLLTGSSVLFDAVYVPGGGGVAALAEERDAIEWVWESYRHCKPIAATGEGAALLQRCPGVLRNGATGGNDGLDAGVLVAEGPSLDLASSFVAAIAAHRFWERAGRNRMDACDADRETRGRGAPVALAGTEASRA